MPGFDRTGPRGNGPMTGRGMGYCIMKENDAKQNQPEDLNFEQEIPFGRFGRGRFFGMRFRGGFGFGGRGFRGRNRFPW